MREAVILSAVRTPIGRAGKGSLRDARPDDLASGAVRAAVEQAGIEPSSLDDHVCGTAYPEGKQGSNLARRVGLLAGLGPGVPGSTVNRFCASSLQGLRLATHAIWSGEAAAYLVSGVESVSQVGRTTKDEDKHPQLLPGGLADAYIPMGETAERVADQFGVSREDMDELALRSHQHAIAAQNSGFFAKEIVPVSVGDIEVSTDDGPRPNASAEGLAKLAPVFRKAGRITAGNACSLNDGASAGVVASGEFAKAHGLKSRGRVLATAVSGVEPEIMGVGPILSIMRVLKRAGMTIRDVDLIELNEAFASQVLAVARETQIDIDSQLNPHGGALALGHPFGMTGMRLITTLLNGLEARDQQIGMATLCVGGGQGMAVLIERT